MAPSVVTKAFLAEFSQMLLESDRDLKTRLDSESEARAKAHKEELLKAALEHARIRESAELERERLRLDGEQKRLRQEEEHRKEVERKREQIAREEAELRRRQLEDKQRQIELNKKALEDAQKLVEYERRIRAQKAQEEAHTRQKEQADRDSQAAAAAAERARVEKSRQESVSEPVPKDPMNSSGSRQASAALLPPRSAPTQGQLYLRSSIEQRELTHNKFLDLHQRAKAFRNSMDREIKANPEVKSLLGDARRAINTRVGQINTDKAHNKTIADHIRSAFHVAMSIRDGPRIDIRPFIISQAIPPMSNHQEATYPAYLLYLLMHFSKRIINQFKQEARGTEGATISWIGLLAISMFGDEKHTWKGVPLIDIFLAKYHKVCPVLFGIYGPENTAKGKLRLGWSQPGGEFVDLNDHYEVMRGLGSGWASMTLRDVNKAPVIPTSEYWRALSYLVNVPPAELTSTHFNVIKGMVREYPIKFIRQFGQAAIAALRLAVIEVPGRAPPSAHQAANQVRAVADVWRKDHYLMLA